MMAMSKTLIASESGPGIEIIRQSRIALDECELNQDQLQLVVRRGRELQDGYKSLVMGLAVPQDFANEEVSSPYVYPPEYRLRSIKEQVERLLVLFPNLNAEWALTQGQQWYDGLTLPEWVEGPLVYPWWKVFGGYHAALAELLKKLAESRPFYNYRDGQLDAVHLRQVDLTAKFEAQLKAIQPGDLLIVPSQAGFRWRGKSVRRGQVLYAQNEFGLGSVAEASRALTHPERYVNFEELDTDCSGDEIRLATHSRFDSAPVFSFSRNGLKLGTNHIGGASGGYGSASGLLPKSVEN
jgi:hypothetical protein